MKKLINIQKTTIGTTEVNAVSARELYLGLGLATQHWAAWSKTNIEQNEFFAQGIDFIQLPTIGSASTPNPPKDYAISIEFAKHISMMAKTAKGHEYRGYFLELEKQPIRQPSLIAVANELEGAIKIANLFGFTGNQALLSANKATEVTTGVNCQLLLGIEFVADKKEHAITPSDIGVRLGGISGMKVNQLLKDGGFQIDSRTAKNAIYWTPTDKGKPYSQLTDTTKKHTDGSTIKQVKWFESVIDLIAA